MKRSWLTRGGLTACLALILLIPATAAFAAPAGDGPPGFWWGTDSFQVSVPGSAPYSMPFLGGAYGGYIGMTGNWAYWQGCKGGFIAFSATNAAQAHTNFTKYGKGVGDGSYWFMGGPGVDPHYNGSTAEASVWGAQQAARALSDIANGPFDYKVVWMDVELPGIKPAADNGWNNVYTSACSGVISKSGIPAAVDRADFNGFANYITAHSSYKVGVYSTASVWTSIFGTGTASLIPNTYEWTYEPETTNYTGRLPVWLVPEPRVRPVRAVLRRTDQRQQPRAHVAVVRRRWRDQRHRRVQRRPRPDRFEPAGLAGTTARSDQMSLPCAAGQPSAAISGSSRMSGCSRCTWPSRHLSLNSASRAPSWRRVSTSVARCPARIRAPSASVRRASV